MASIGRIEISRIPVTVWLIIIIMAYAPVWVSKLWPWFDYSDAYYTVSFMQNHVLNWAHTVAQQGGITGTLGSIVYGAGVAMQAILMLLEGLLTGFYPLWRLMGLDTPVRGMNLAVTLSVLVEILFGFTLYKAYKGGLRV